MYYGHSFLVSNTYFGIFINYYFLLLYNLENSGTVTFKMPTFKLKLRFAMV